VARVQLEIVCASIDDAAEAQAGGADRIELGSAAMVGGLTPSLGTLIEVKRRTRLPLLAMVRPREGGFCYSHDEFLAMMRDAELLLENGADGIAFGVLRDDCSVDTERCREINNLIQPKEAVFHRAFDVVPDPATALEALIDLGLKRVLTSGQKPTALEGAPLIASLIEQARGRIEILPAGRIRPNNVAQLIAATGCTQVHLAAFSRQMDPSVRNPEIRFGSDVSLAGAEYERTDREQVREMRERLDAL
jgi:copper homeostasis protein